MAQGTPLLPLMLSFLLLFLSIGTKVVQCVEHKQVLYLDKFQWKELKHVSKCVPQQSSEYPYLDSKQSPQVRRENGATILEMKQRDYCSGHIKNWDETLQHRLVSDDRRVQSLQLRIKKQVSSHIEDLSSTQIPLTSGVKLQTLNYIVTIELGGRKMTVIVDTGSDLTWIQCKPCISCYDQQDPFFDPSLSHSYGEIMCNSSTCQSLSNATGYSGVCGTKRPSCNYLVSYGDGSYTRGELARDYLNLSSTAVPDFVFGCGRNNKGLFGGASGLMGLGRSQLSLVSQTSTNFSGTFSYCLPSTDTEDSGSLILGESFSVFKNSTPITYTNMISNPLLSTFYLLNLTGISIGGVALQSPGLSNGGILIDSGTVITRLAPSVYRALRTEFLQQFSGYPPAPSYSILDTCFNLTGYEELDIPTLKLRFEDSVEMTVDVMGMFYVVKTDASQVCLAIASLTYEDELGIIGNYQQKNLRVIYDTKNSKLGFAEEICSYNL
ncbi:hypothetical protein IFM89_018083 [Coptis chinensis]|uniref:Peptidase A1 domain-containing protein n=1 Tax=Coptis chinensis TaxID=261450 RepID=A0A835I8F0_9MAGN|nr:hypothetical protein IFM89_018083 [Coptis chinensis]